MLNKMGLFLLIVVPYLLVFFLIKDYTEHLEFEIKSVDMVMESSYFLGCIETHTKSVTFCKDRSKNYKIATRERDFK